MPWAESQAAMSNNLTRKRQEEEKATLRRKAPGPRHEEKDENQQG